MGDQAQSLGFSDHFERVKAEVPISQGIEAAGPLRTNAEWFEQTYYPDRGEDRLKPMEVLFHIPELSHRQDFFQRQDNRLGIER